ncbi:vWA domain-containing protein [Archaeoglobus neptunius]|uniref:vWA domain-containing protein n=1 Tax=Archaeoglobus neptunius TaxID=2798580 RepID=UPI0019275F06|nr:VWA domain-containing protein [Archaeoglobus neptunius]
MGNAIAQQLQGDVVFVIDESGSMGDEITAVKNNVGYIFNYLQSHGDFKVGLVGFGATFSPNPNNPRVVCQLTDDSTTFTNCLDSIVPTGGYQPGFDAIVLATNQTALGLRGVASCVILITDEDADPGVNNKTDAVNALDSVPAYFIGIFDPQWGSAQNDYGTPNGVAGLVATGGTQVNLADFNSDPTGTLNIILNNCTQALQNVTTQCNDGIDNDGDGLIDYPNDPGCSSPQDNNEYNVPPSVPEFSPIAVAALGLFGAVVLLRRK